MHPSTKHDLPRLPPSHVLPERLLQALNRSQQRRLTLVSAGAGWGKTTLLSAWAAEQAGPVAWASLDPSDDDQVRFWTVVVTALRSCLPDEPATGALALRVLEASERSPAMAVATALANDLAARVPGAPALVLVLDDYHLIGDTSIHEGVAFLIEHLPGSVRVVLSSRVDPELPIARWRASGLLAEFRAADLSLSADESSAFLSKALGEHHALSPDGARSLHASTEGWITGLQLAATAMRQQADPTALVRSFTGGHRYVSDYFVTEVLHRQRPPMQAFLLETSVLARLSADVCAALTGKSEPEAQEALASLERENLFVVALDDERRWYRMHDLFRDALAARLQATDPAAARSLHRRAARWFAQRGSAAGHAVRHALAAGDFPFAADLVAHEAPQMWKRGGVRTVHDWVSALPDDVLRDHAMLALEATRELLESVHGAVQEVYSPARRQAEVLIERVDAVTSRGGGKDAIRIERRLQLLRALLAGRALFKGGDTDRIQRLAEQAVALGQHEEARWKRVGLGIRWGLIEARQRQGALLIPELLEAKRQAIDAEDQATAIAVLRVLAMAYLRAARPRGAERVCMEALGWIEGDDAASAPAGYFHYYLSSCYYQTNRLDEAAREVRDVLRIARTWQQAPLIVAGNLNAMLLDLADGNHAGASEALATMEALVQQERFATYASFVHAARVQFWLCTGDLDAAGRWATSVVLSSETWDPNRVAELLLLLRVYLAQERHDEALATMALHRDALDRPEDGDTTLHYLALHLVALHAVGRHRDAHGVATRLLAMTVAERQVRLFIDEGEPMRSALRGLLARRTGGPPAPDGHAAFVADLLAAFDCERRSRPERSSPTVEPGAQGHEAMLTPREREVLRLMMAGASNAEISAELAITRATVKKHVGNVLGKLGAQNRVQILARGRARSSIPI